MNKYYVETGNIRTVIHSPNPALAARNALAKMIAEDAYFGKYGLEFGARTAVNEAGYYSQWSKSAPKFFNETTVFEDTSDILYDIGEDELAKGLEGMKEDDV